MKNENTIADDQNTQARATLAATKAAYTPKEQTGTTADALKKEFPNFDDYRARTSAKYENEGGVYCKVCESCDLPDKIGTPKFRAAFAATLTEVCKSVIQYRRMNGFTFATEILQATHGGRKFVKIMSADESETGSVTSKHIVAFIEIETGDIFKPASLRAPAKHARGNIYSNLNGLEAFSPSGSVRYL